MGKVFVFGSINTDLVIETPYMPANGETIMGKNFLTNAGGKGANQAVACSKMGAETYMIGAVGNDGFGGHSLDSLSGFGVHCGLIQKLDDVPSGVAVIVIENGDNRIILDSGANFAMDFAEVERSIRDNVKQGDVFVVQLEIPLDYTARALKIAKECGAVTILNPAPAKKLPLEMLEYTDVIIPNETETEIILGKKAETEEQIRAAAREFFRLGIKNVIITLGSKGCVYLFGDDCTFYPAHRVKAVDTTATGDTFIGCLSSQIAAGRSIADSIDLYQKASSITVQRKGAQVSIPTLDEVLNG